MTTRYLATCDCGYGRTHHSPAMAQHGLLRHSCDRYRLIADKQARGEARMAAVDRTPKPCLHVQADHQHGTYACYTLDACRCQPCAHAVREYEQNRVRQHAYGRWTHWVDAEPSRAHVRTLMDQGMGLKRIVAVSEISQGQLWKLLYGKRQANGSQNPSKRVHRDTETKILAIQLDLAAGQKVDSTGAARRIQALVAIGWSMSKIAARLGVLRSNFTSTAHGRTGITVAQDKAIRALYDNWSMQLPPEAEWRDKIAASRSRNYAKRLGWLPPLAWDDEHIDDPSYQPLLTEPPATDELGGYDEAAVLRRLNGDRRVRVTKADRQEIVRRGLAAGRSYLWLQEQCGINKPERYIPEAAA